MKITWIEYSFLCVLNLLHLAFYQTEAISREISYPLGSVIGKNTFHESPVQERFQPFDMIVLPTEVPRYPPKAKTKKKFKRKNKKKTMKHSMKAQDGNNVTKTKSLKRKRSRKKFVKTSLNEEKNSDSFETITLNSRKPVDIVVHIKMQD